LESSFDVADVVLLVNPSPSIVVAVVVFVGNGIEAPGLQQ